MLKIVRVFKFQVSHVDRFSQKILNKANTVIEDNLVD